MAVAMARTRKWCALPASASRRASETRYTADRYAHTLTARTPPTADVGLIQLAHRSPAWPPAGTRPDAIPPATAPKQYGTSTDDDAKAAPKMRRSLVRNTALRNA